MADNNEIDELFEVKNAFYLGNYQQCISEAQKLKLSSPEQRLARDVLLYRGYIALNKLSVVRDEIHAGSPAQLQPLKLLADYLGGRRDQTLPELEKRLAGDLDPEASVTLFLVAASVYLHEGNHEAALRALHHGVDTSLECAAMTLQTYLAMNRPDLAQKQLRSMQERDDDATITQLAHAWFSIAVGGEKLQDAYYIFQELMDKTSATPLLLNGQGVCYMGMCKYADAEIVLQTALERDADCAETLINLIALSQRTNKPPEVASRYLSQLRDAHASHPYVRDYIVKENEFDRLVQQYSLMVKV